MHRRRVAFWVSALVSLFAVASMGFSASVTASAATHSNSAATNTSWAMGGFNISNTRSNPFERTISPLNASQLAVKWTFTTHGDVSATPAVVDGAVYFPDWGGYLNKVNAATGRLIWSHKISDYDGIAGAISRTSPAVWHGIVYIGDQNGAHLMAINAASGELLWIRQLDSFPSAVLTQSPLVYDGVVYEGVSSLEEGYAESDSYPCCSFRGSITASNAWTGAPLWKTYTIPDNGGVPGGYSGGSVWGGTPALDPRHGLLFVTTGTNYSEPQSVTDCQTAGGSAGQCLSPGDHIDSILALNMHTGALVWATGNHAFDAWNFGCVVSPPNNCPVDPGGDVDFADGPHLFTIPGPNGTRREVVGAGQKNGEYWTVDALTGQVVWSATLGPASPAGGIMWGTSVSDGRIYLAEADYYQLPYQLADGTTTTHSSYAALDAATGKVLWQFVDPAGFAEGALTTANGVLYAGSTSGDMYAIDAATGKILFDFTAPYASSSGPAVVNGTVYWGDGYVHTSMFTGSLTTGTFYAFSLHGR